MNADDVAQYLRTHPDFLVDHSELFTRLTVPHPRHNGQAISLAERQLYVLRDKIRQLENKLSELIRFGEENDSISEKVHRLSVALLEAEDYTGAREALFSSLAHDFQLPRFALRIWNSVIAHEDIEFSAVSEAVRLYVAGLSRPYCGAPNNIEMVGWLGAVAPDIHSVAVVPLHRQTQVFGVLVLGSEESERFYPEMGTLYLERIGDLSAAALLCTLG